jgi:hypothetical protein
MVRREDGLDGEEGGIYSNSSSIGSKGCSSMLSVKSIATSPCVPDDLGVFDVVWLRMLSVLNVSETALPVHSPHD